VEEQKSKAEATEVKPAEESAPQNDNSADSEAPPENDGSKQQ